MTPTQVEDLSTAKTRSDPATSKTMGNDGTTQTFADVVARVIRAVAAAVLVFKSSIGSSASDVCFKRGTTVSSGSVNSSAQLDWLGLGLDGVEDPRHIIFASGLWRSYYATAPVNTVFSEQYVNGQRVAFFATSPGFTTSSILYLGNSGGIGDSSNQRIYLDPAVGSVVMLGRFGVSSASIAAVSRTDRAQPDDSRLHSFVNFGTEKSAVRGNGEYENFVAGGGIVLRSPNGNRWRLSVDNAGTISVAAA